MNGLPYFSELVRKWLAYHGMGSLDVDENTTVYHLTIDNVGDVHIGYLTVDNSIVLFSSLGSLNELPDNILKQCLVKQHFKELPHVNFGLDETSEQLIVWLKTQLDQATVEVLDQQLAQLLEEGLIAFKQQLTANTSAPITPGVIV
ncbi:type III secretion system chaperone [Endozoicomonas sp. SM1973]|uniref:Type III secretion system chaperone n=1 Tax=Spartinivicinus marinus TaxID=2994442 RepID=A0A853IB30_9GAMM|nr:type III secretion system chaperone [Spartinivicinus marinus]MCX4024910.1 type III secretion system chaperone [Spartinivicinus marinus]NYZ66445.1 type III secretion system chaperone [Spartinivicinus marinus]